MHEVLLHRAAPVAAEVAADRARAAAFVGSVVPIRARHPSTTRSPSTTAATTGPEDMNATSGS